MSQKPPITGPISADALKHAVWGGTRAIAGAQVVSQLITIVTLAILFRLVAPSDYGLLGMVLPLLYFLRIFTKLGLNVSTVQRAELSAGEISALFWVNMALGAATTVATALLAPALAWFYAEPQLVELTVALAGVSLVAAVGSQHQALLERRVKLGHLAACRVLAQLCGSIAAVITALAGGGVWALVVQQYAELAAGSLLVWLAEPWRPTRPTRDVELASHLRFGGYYSASSVFFFLAGNLDKVLVGRMLGDYALGLYSQAFNLMLKPVYLVTDPLVSVMLTALARAAHDERTRYELLVSFYRVVAITLFPAGIGVILVGDRFMEILGGPRWSEAGTLVSVLGIAILGQGFINIAGPVFTAAGRTERLFLGSIVITLIVAQACAFGWWWGDQLGDALQGVAWGYALAIVLVLTVPYTCYCLWSTGYRAGPVFAALGRPALAALAMGVVVWLAGGQIRSWPAVLQLAVEVPLGVVSYLFFAREEVRWLQGEFRQLRGSSPPLA